MPMLPEPAPRTDRIFEHEMDRLDAAIAEVLAESIRWRDVVERVQLEADRLAEGVAT